MAIVSILSATQIAAMRGIHTARYKKLAATATASAAESQVAGGFDSFRDFEERSGWKGQNGSRTWNIQNLDTAEIVSGQYGEDSYKESDGSNYAEMTALNRRYPILKYTSGKLNTIQFDATIVAKSTADYARVKDSVNKLRKWSLKVDELGRPPLISFWIADGSIVNYPTAILNANVTYKNITRQGNHTEFSVGISITRYEEYNLETVSFDTKYYFASDGDTHELLAAREYGRPLLGVALRQAHGKAELELGDQVKLPAPQGSISRAVIKPTSTALKGITDPSSKTRATFDQTLLDRTENHSYYFATE